MPHATIDPMAVEGPHTISVPASVRFPLELDVPPNFDPSDPGTWPRVEGRLEYVSGRLLYLPPCGLRQQGTAIDVGRILGTWSADHPRFFVGGLEAGMMLGKDARGADAAIWHRQDLGPLGTGFARVPPILAVEIEGQEERERNLREKSLWYLSRGVPIVWIVLPSTPEVIVVGNAGEVRCGEGERLPPDAALPGLEPDVADFFRQIG